MKAEIKLGLRTREVYNLFERKINNNRLFIDAFIYKKNILLNRSRNKDSKAIKLLSEIKQDLIKLKQQFSDETIQFEELLSKKKELQGKQINYVIQFYPKITISDEINLLFVELLEAYDNLIATIKLLRIAGCFETDETYFFYIKKQQKAFNTLISSFILAKL